jgi:hypothetical protein
MLLGDHPDDTDQTILMTPDQTVIRGLAQG